MWDLILSVPEHCLSFYFTGSKPRPRQAHILIQFSLDALKALDLVFKLQLDIKLL